MERHLTWRLNNEHVVFFGGIVQWLVTPGSQPGDRGSIPRASIAAGWVSINPDPIPASTGSLVVRTPSTLKY